MPLVSKYKGFIFDYGGVLAFQQSEEDQARMAKLAGIDVARFSELYWEDRTDYDRDDLSGCEYWQRVASRTGQTFSDRVVEELIESDNSSWMQFDTVMWDWIDQLRAAGNRVAILSNMPRDLGSALRSRTDRFERVDHVTLSYELRSVKPEPAIYEHCLEGLGTAREETLFFDDRIANVQGAEVLGIDGIEFTSRDEVLLRVRA